MLRLRLVNGLIIEVAVGEIEITSYKKLTHVELFNPSREAITARSCPCHISIWYP